MMFCLLLPFKHQAFGDRVSEVDPVSPATPANAGTVLKNSLLCIFCLPDGSMPFSEECLDATDQAFR
ncbi:MAG TPA: hypothetical protein DEQ47_16220 [Solibacterales bacterium]|nr:hypothetical protein [Bryobacterales bacterium]